MSICLGANSTFVAMAKQSEAFRDIKCMLALQPNYMSALAQKPPDTMGDPSLAKLLSNKIHERNGFKPENFGMVPFARSIH